MKKDFLYYNLKQSDGINIKVIRSFFRDLPEDRYLKGGYRFRRLSRFALKDNKLIHLPHKALMQSKAYNPLLGGILRDYPEIEERTIKTRDFRKLIRLFLKLCNANPDTSEIRVHLIRIMCTKKRMGNPSPEGIHQDEVDYVGIFCIERKNIIGAITSLYYSKEDNPSFEKILRPREMLIINDKRLYHYTSPIQTKGERGYRDTIIITAQPWKKE